MNNMLSSRNVDWSDKSNCLCNGHQLTDPVRFCVIVYHCEPKDCNACRKNGPFYTRFDQEKAKMRTAEDAKKDKAYQLLPERGPERAAYIEKQRQKHRTKRDCINDYKYDEKPKSVPNYYHDGHQLGCKRSTKAKSGSTHDDLARKIEARQNPISSVRKKKKQ